MAFNGWPQWRTSTQPPYSTSLLHLEQPESSTYESVRYNPYALPSELPALSAAPNSQYSAVQSYHPLDGTPTRRAPFHLEMGYTPVTLDVQSSRSRLIEAGVPNALRGSRPRQSKYSQVDWETHLPKIKQLYVTEGKSLEETMNIMKHNHDFEPSSKMYKDKFKELKWFKYLPVETAQWMATKAEQRKHEKGSDTIFYYGDRTWDIDRVNKSLQRAQSRGVELAGLPVTMTPPGISIQTPANGSPLAPLLSPIVSNPRAGRWTPTLNPNTPRLQHPRLTWHGYNRTDVDALVGQAQEFQRSRNWAEAEKKFREHLAGAEKLYSPTHEYTTTAGYRLAEFYAQLDRVTEADRVLDWMSEKHVQHLGLTHEKTAGHFLRIGRLFDNWSRHRDATNFFNDVVAAYENAHLPVEAVQSVREIPRVPRHQISMPPLSTEQDNTDNRNPQFTLTDDPIATDHHLGIANSRVLVNDATVEPLLVQLADLCEANLGSMAKQLLNATCSLVDLHRRLENREKMVVALERAFRAFRMSIDSEAERSEAFFDGCIKVARMQLLDGQVEPAKEITERVGNEAESDFGVDSELTIELYIRIGKDFQTNGQWPEAELWFERALCASMAADRKYHVLSCTTQRLENALENQHYEDPTSKTGPIHIQSHAWGCHSARR